MRRIVKRHQRALTRRGMLIFIAVLLLHSGCSPRDSQGVSAEEVSQGETPVGDYRPEDSQPEQPEDWEAADSGDTVTAQEPVKDAEPVWEWDGTGEEPWKFAPVSTGVSPELQEHIDNGDKLVAITYDDGPHKEHTPQLLEILREEDVKATFYLVGMHMEYFPQVPPQIAADGHQIGSHTYAHKKLTTLSAEERRATIGKTNLLIEEMTGEKPTTMRPPAGDFNDEVKAEMGAPIILWAVDPEDWKVRDAWTVYHHVVDNVQDGDIILLHDIYGSTVDASRWIIPELKKRGFVFVTVDELILARGEAENGKTYSRMRPTEPVEKPGKVEKSAEVEKPGKVEKPAPIEEPGAAEKLELEEKPEPGDEVQPGEA